MEAPPGERPHALRTCIRSSEYCSPLRGSFTETAVAPVSGGSTLTAPSSGSSVKPTT